MSFGFGGWAISKTCFDYIRELLPGGKVILELGSGEGTAELAKYYRMYSIENQKEWINKYDSTYIYAPIKKYVNVKLTEDKWWGEFSDKDAFIPPIGIPGEGSELQSGWFDPEIVKENLPKKYDLILVDGPNGLIGRGGFYKYLDYFDINVPIIIDDINRKAERILMEKVSEKLEKEYIILDDEVTGVIL